MPLSERTLRLLPLLLLCVSVLLWLALSLLNSQTQLVVNRDTEGNLSSIYAVSKTDAAKLTGRMLAYWPNGQVRLQTDFEHAVYVGELIEWHSKGTPARLMQYAQGREYGLQRGWRSDGLPEFSYEMRYGRRFGVPGTMPCVGQ